MTGQVLLLCSSTDGQTRRICDRLRAQLEDAGAAVTLVAIDDAQHASPAGFDLAVVGARIRYGKTDRRVIAWTNEHAAQLNAMPSAFFSVNVVARKPGKDRAHSNPYVLAFLRQVRWRPGAVDVFAGKVDYPRYAALDRAVIRFIMALTDGPTHRDAVVEFTDWGRVAEFGRSLVAKLPARQAPAPLGEPGQPYCRGPLNALGIGSGSTPMPSSSSASVSSRDACPRMLRSSLSP